MDLATRPPYETVDFKALAKQDDDLKTLWQEDSGKLDFQDPETAKTLSKAILKVDFNLSLDLPDDRLCPPIPNRWNYVSWIHALLDSTSPDYSGRYDPEREVVGLDIGIGASAIYTMLALKSRPKWTMCATDVDKKSFEYAARNLSVNGLLTRTKLLQTVDSQPLVPLQYLGVKRLDFTICNPPFFTDEKEMQASLSGQTKGGKPNAVCTGSENEMVCQGGDLGFVTRIVDESLVLRGKVGWYTSLFGKMSSAKAVIGLLKEKGVTNWAVGSIDVGSGTKRWIVAWSFGDYRPCQSIARLSQIANEYLPFPTEYRFPLPPNIHPASAKSIIDQQARRLHIRWNPITGVGEAAGNVWSRAYRRESERKRREAAASGAEDVPMEEDAMGEDMDVKQAFRIKVLDEGEREVVIEWLRGRDQVLWESFCGMVHRSFKKV